MPIIARRACVLVLLTSALAACSDDDPTSAATADAAASDARAADAAVATDADTSDADTSDADTSDASGPSADAGVAGVGRCVYVNPFSRGDECKAYTGAGWTAEAAAADCAAVLPRTAGTFEAGQACGFEAELGRCAVEAAGELGYAFVSAGEDASRCALARTGCETFSGGTFTADARCDAPACAEPGPSTGTPFHPLTLDCRPALPGEPPGNGPDGQVCTPVIISGCTEAGRRFEDYGSCEAVLTQRPYSAFELPATATPDDPRLADDAYVAELAWMRTQVEACACTCCHTGTASRDGASGWNTESGPLWIDTIPDSGLAMLAGLVDSVAFGAVDPSQNNGFDRLTTGMPTTDVPRLQRFLEAEFARRGFAPADAEQYPPFGGPLVAQADFEPQACPEGVGVDAEGHVRWSSGGARYVYVLSETAANPGVPPNRDVPEGTVWLLAVPHTEAPIGCTDLRFGETLAGAVRRVPAEGEPAPALTAGQRYQLQVLADVGVPLTRCVFTAP